MRTPCIWVCMLRDPLSRSGRILRIFGHRRALSCRADSPPLGNVKLLSEVNTGWLDLKHNQSGGGVKLEYMLLSRPNTLLRLDFQDRGKTYIPVSLQSA